VMHEKKYGFMLHDPLSHLDMLPLLEARQENLL
jgi:hypothetical protein